MEDYENNISNLKTMIEKAKESVITSKTNLKFLKEQKEQLEKECSDLYGVPIEKAPEFLQKQKEELSFIVSKVNAIGLDNVSIETITDDQIKALSELAKLLPSGV